MNNSNYKTLLRDKLKRYFNIPELRNIVFELSYDWDELEGNTKSEKIISLISYCSRRQHLSELISIVETERPKTNWKNIKESIKLENVYPLVGKSNGGKSSYSEESLGKFAVKTIALADKIELVRIPTGPFVMGNNQGKSEEQPKHALLLKEYYMARMPITNHQYSVFVRANKNKNPPWHWNDRNIPPEEKKDHPVVNVSWFDAIEYCKWLTQITGIDCNLPSEAEWEKGARSNTGYTYPWGDTWNEEKANVQESGIGTTTPVTQYQGGASEYGILNMAGNVWEWTRSLWGEDGSFPNYIYEYDPNDGRENMNEGEEVFRIVRGGSFFNEQKKARCSYRYRRLPIDKRFELGFRIVAYPK